MQNAFTPSGAVAITPSDATQVDLFGLYVGVTGNINVVDSLGVTTLFSNVPAGEVISLRITQVKATSTTATNLVGFVR